LQREFSLVRPIASTSHSTSLINFSFDEKTLRIIAPKANKRGKKIYQPLGLVLYRAEVHYSRIETIYILHKPASSVLQQLF
jgi:hypothetical protein